MPARRTLTSMGRPEKPQDLQSHLCVTFDNLASPEVWRFASAGGEELVQIRSRLTVTTAEAAIGGAINGLGLTRLLSYQITASVKDGLLETVLENYELPTMAGQPRLYRAGPATEKSARVSRFHNGETENAPDLRISAAEAEHEIV